MGDRRHHYERAFESYLRATRTPYVSVNEARRALLPERAELSLVVERPAASGGPRRESLKSFDFVLYGEPASLLVEVKGRRIGRRGAASLATRGRLENWVTRDDVEALTRWERLFNGRAAASEGGEGGFRSAFVFVYLCEQQPPDALFQEIFEFERRWYALRMVRVDAYAASMRERSARWGTVHLDRAVFESLSTPLAAGVRARVDRPPRRVSSTPRLQAELQRRRSGRSVQDPPVAPAAGKR